MSLDYGASNWVCGGLTAAGEGLCGSCKQATGGMRTSEVLSTAGLKWDQGSQPIFLVASIGVVCVCITPKQGVRVCLSENSKLNSLACRRPQVCADIWGHLQV